MRFTRPTCPVISESALLQCPAVLLLVFCKAFYRPDFTLDEMNHINFDWYRSSNCNRQTPEQVRHWVEQNGLDVVTFDAALEGISVIARRP